ncbi:unnamed protein product [Orchesella dallaii]|uniref:CUB domain-containing protein n=1 Tax=Orchesella dallaii TaxID=48710 RepID=A0ABP1RBT0_9HEXA
MGKLLPLQCVAFLLLLTQMVSSMSRFMEPEDLALQQPILFPEGSSYEVRSQSELEEQSIEENNIKTPRKSKFFPYFLIQFPNEPCTTSSGSGVCVSAKDCRASGGTSQGVCAQGFGSCCRFSRSCGSDQSGDVIVRENSTELKSSAGGSCRYVLAKARGICQVRLDFTEFEFGSGLPTGDCSTTKISISGGINLPQGSLDLCGNFKGQHLYLNYGAADKIYISSSSPAVDTDNYNIRVSYIRCESRQIVPSHCTQYYTGAEGEIRSINFPHQQLNNQDYTVCIADPRAAGARNGRQISNPARIQWETCGTDPENFRISGKEGDAPVTNPSECVTDYIQIFGGNRQCGNTFSPEEVTTTPYLLQVKFDDAESKTPEAVIIVKKPAGLVDCSELNEADTTCSEETPGGTTCVCIRVSGTPDLDENNTGFCLKYKIIQ